MLVLVGNKADLIEKEEVSEKEAEEYAKNIGAIFKITSAAKGMGIEELFNTIGKEIINGKPKEEGEKKGSKLNSEKLSIKKGFHCCLSK